MTMKTTTVKKLKVKARKMINQTNNPPTAKRMIKLTVQRLQR